MADSFESIGAAQPSGVHSGRRRESGQYSALSMFLVVVTMSLVLVAEFRRATAAARRYEELRYGRARAKSLAGADIPWQVFREFYSP